MVRLHLPDRFAPLETEYRHARETAALIDKNYRAFLFVSGPDRLRYLNAVLTNDVRETAAGRGVPSLLLNAQGHILAELEIYAIGDRHLIISYEMIRERLLETLDKFIIMDDVTLEDATPALAALGVEGPRSPEILRQVAGIEFDSLAELGHVEANIRAANLGAADPGATNLGAADPGATNLGATNLGAANLGEANLSAANLSAANLGAANLGAANLGAANLGAANLGAAISARIFRRSPGAPGFEVLVPRENVAAIWDTLLDSVRAQGGGPIGYSTLNTLRLEAGVPWFGYDFDETVIPHEAGLENSHISYSKGCYTGQEIVERVRSRGHVNRTRAAVEFSAAAIPERGTKLFAAGKEVGQVTRAAFSPAAQHPIGMAYLRREHSAPGTTLEYPAGAARVISLPLAR